MVWGDFLIQKFKRELVFLGEHIPKILTAAFLCSCGGILLWVNGTNLWQILNSRITKFSVPITGAFLLCLLSYALCGVILALLLTAGMTIGFSCGKRTAGNLLSAFSLTCAVYLLLLVWYAIFFCTHLTFFALILLSLAFFGTILIFLLMRHNLLTLKLPLLLLFAIELYFLCINFRCI